MPGNDKKYERIAAALGTRIAERGHELVFGANSLGLMGTLADAVLAGGGKVTGVVPGNVPSILKGVHPGITSVIKTNDMSDRKRTMLEMADAYVALPGGIGTLDEVTEVICLSQIGIHKKPCILVNLDGFYEPLKEMLAVMGREGFAHPEGYGKLLFSQDLDEIFKFMEE